MKLSEWKEKYDKEHPGAKLRAITYKDLIDMEFDEPIPPDLEVAGVKGKLTPRGTIRVEIRNG